MRKNKENKKYLLGIIATNLDWSVYDTNEISVIRGGSFLLLRSISEIYQEWEEHGRPAGISSISKISMRASNGLFEVEVASGDPEAAMQELCNDARAKLDGATRGIATYAIDYVPLDDDFEAARCRLMNKTSWRQYRELSLVVPALEENAIPCELDGVRPATDKIGLKPGRSFMASSSACNRRKKGVKAREEYYATLLKGNEELPKSLYARKISELCLTRNLEELAIIDGIHRTDGKMAYIYMDGNRFGTMNLDCKSADEIRSFDKSVEDMQKAMLYGALDWASSKKLFWTDIEEGSTKVRALRIECLLWGGDEIEFIVPARFGWGFLKTLFEAIDGKCFSQNGVEQPLTHSAGIVFCHHNAPVLFVRDIARKLAGELKDDLPANLESGKASKYNRLHYLVLESFDMLGAGLERVVKGLYGSEINFDALSVRAEEMDDIEKRMHDIIMSFPHRKVYEIVRAIRQDREPQPIIKKAIAGLGDAEKKRVEQAIKKIAPKDKKERWFMIAELWDYLS